MTYLLVTTGAALLCGAGFVLAVRARLWGFAGYWLAFQLVAVARFAAAL